VSKGRRDLSADEKKLWRRVAAAVKPRRGKSLPEGEGDTSQTAPPRVPAKKIAVPPPQPVRARVAAPPPPADRGGEKRVRRGKLEIGATLDLHGHTQDTGRSVLIRFLQNAHARGDRTVIVITGVGRGGQGVLKQRLPDWLGSSEVRAIVSGFAQAHRAHGGGGAFYVFLKPRARGE
jgi:DNA-nicking Smr family endonuclease